MSTTSRYAVKVNGTIIGYENHDIASSCLGVFIDPDDDAAVGCSWEREMGPTHELVVITKVEQGGE